MTGRPHSGTGLLLVVVVAAALPALAGGIPEQDTARPPRGLGAPDAGAVITGLGFEVLPAALPVLYPPDLGAEQVERIRRRQVNLLEARAFWWNMIGALPEGGMIGVDSARWTACGVPQAYGFPATRVWSREYGLLTLFPLEENTTFSEDAAIAVQVAPPVHSSRLLAHGLADEAGAAAYTEAWSWVLLGESLASSLRIEASAWWQRRLVGASAAALFLSSPRGAELAPGLADVLDAWTWFWTGYARPVALDLRTCAVSPPVGPGPAGLELDARLYLLGHRIWQAWGADCFDRYRQAWPIGSRFESVTAALDTLLAVMPGLDEWPERLFSPRPEEPPGMSDPLRPEELPRLSEPPRLLEPLRLLEPPRP
jgi:hypothetical protein